MICVIVFVISLPVVAIFYEETSPDVGLRKGEYKTVGGIDIKLNCDI